MTQHSPLFKRVVKPYFILITIIISITIVIVYFASVSNIRNETVKSLQQLAQRTAQLTDTYIEEMGALADQVNHQQKITGLFYNVQNGNDKQTNRFDIDVLNSIDISSTLKSLLAGRTGQYNISIYNNYGDFISSHNYMLKHNTFESFNERGGYDEAIKELSANDGVRVLPPAENPWTNSNVIYITLQKELKNEYSDDVCGIIEVRTSLKQLDELLSGGDQVLIRNLENGDIIYPYGCTEEENVSYITAPLRGTGWEAAIPYNDGIPEGFRAQLILLFIVLYIILMGLFLVVALIIGKYISDPIMQLAKRVREIDTPEGKLLPTEGAIDEIKELEGSFNTMLKHMNQSLQREKEAYSLALQAQMNPHFLYNSLSVIGAAGMESGADTVYDMCIELSEMLRYVAAYEKVTVPLREEIAHTKNYLSLMKSRYEDLFVYSVEIDEELLNIPVPKLFIQPLAENCFMHGFKEKEPPWKVEISMRGSRDGWELVIRDNGSGIAEERINEIMRKTDAALADMTVGNIGGLGIVNTIVRLKMTHSRDIKYYIENDNGMLIRISSGVNACSNNRREGCECLR
ncbi:MAG: histidine kinase [Clostridiales bacterium]|nr:histidine kinase [Clostridiales bacterium]